MSSPRRWSALPQSAAVDAALRRAAAGVCGFYGGHGSVPGLHDPSDHYRLVCAWEDWLPDQNRDDLARVFQVGLLRAADKRKRGKFWTIYEMTLAAPRAALCALLDLLAVVPPAEIRNDE